MEPQVGQIYQVNHTDRPVAFSRITKVTEKRVSYKVSTSEGWQANKNFMSVVWISRKDFDKFITNGWWSLTDKTTMP